MSFVRVRFGETCYDRNSLLAGPDVFLPDAVAHAATKVEICRVGLRGLPPLNEDAETAATGLEVWQAIYEKDVAMMEKSDIIIANLTPFADASADAGTLIEVVGFSASSLSSLSNTAENFDHRIGKQLGQSNCGPRHSRVSIGRTISYCPERSSAADTRSFFQPTQSSGFDALDVFETCVKAAAPIFCQAAMNV